MDEDRVLSRSLVERGIEECYSLTRNNVITSDDFMLWENHMAPGTEIVLDLFMETVHWEDIKGQLVDQGVPYKPLEEWLEAQS